jgi:chromosome segregation ATPase
VSTEKRELEHMLRNFNIFIDNPCCVLTQEESKKFIGGQEKEKYTFFLKATGLERIRDELKMVIQTNENVTNTLAQSKTKLKTKNHALQKLKDELNELMELDKYDAKISENTAKIFWINVKTDEDVVKVAEKSVVEVGKKVTRAQEKLAELESKEAAQGTMADITAQHEDMKTTLGEVVVECTECQTKVASAGRSAGAKETDIRRINGNIRELASRIAGCNAQLKKIHDDAMRRAEAGERVWIERLDETTKLIEATEKKIVDVTREKKNYQQDVTNLGTQCFDQDAVVGALRDSISKKERERNEIKKGSSTADRLRRFGQKVPMIMADIHKERFRGEVIGPIGMHVSLSGRLNPRQSSIAIEKVAGAQLRNFMITNADDRAPLERILRKHQAFNDHRIYVQVSKAPRYNPPAIENALTILDLLQVEVERPEVFNILVDVTSMDRVVVAQNEVAVQRDLVVRNHQGRDGFRSGILKAITIDEDTTVLYRNGNRASEVSFDQCHFVLAADASIESKKDLDDSLAMDSDLMKQEKKRLAELTAQRTAADRGVVSCNTKLQTLNRDISGYKKMKREQEDGLRDAQDENDVDLGPLQAELEELKSGLKVQEDTLRDQNAALAELQATEKEMRKLKEGADRRKTVLVNRIREQEAIVEQFLEEKELMAKAIKDQKKNILDLEASVRKTESVVAKAVEEMDKSVLEARTQTALVLENWDGVRLNVGERETSEMLRKQVGNFVLYLFAYNMQ